MATDQAITDDPVDSSATTPEIELAPDAAPATEAAPDAPPSTDGETPEPESPEVTLPFSIPESLRPPEPTTQSGMSEAEQEQALARIEELEADREKNLNTQSQNQQSVSIQDRAQGYLSTLQLENLSAEQIARWAATEVEKAVSDGKTNTQQAERQGNNERVRRETAEAVGKAFNVNPADLMRQPSKAAMEERAEWIVELNKTRTDITALQRAKVPDQPFIDGGQGAGAVNGKASYIQKLKDGEGLPSSAEIDRVTAGFLR